MGKVALYSFLMICGIVLSQFVEWGALKAPLNFLTVVILGYIMIEVGLEFTIDKGNLKSYGKDYLIAMTAATLPWIFCGLYFWYFFDISLSDAAIIARFAAPTSAGVLFAMLAAAGLATSWVFKKARILAIFDDLDTVLLIIPLQMMHIGMDSGAFVLLGIVMALLYVGYRYLHQLKIPISKGWILLYALGLTVLLKVFEHTTLIALEILLPAFVLGCVLFNPHDPAKDRKHRREHAYLEAQGRFWHIADDWLKSGYMFLVGCSLPALNFKETSLSFLAFHVLVITLLANIGKLFPAFCYKNEASLNERMALSVAMWPRGEVGAGILLISSSYALSPVVLQLAGLSLALNLVLTGFFIYIVLWLVKSKRSS
ncbi:MAG: cation:proton antiporter [Candidatus Melainabacteria bacterium]|nr:cation:proton antiporter [Candidatus Melainabacteria bacterium]